jgi:hypothetical protein
MEPGHRAGNPGEIRDAGSLGLNGARSAGWSGPPFDAGAARQGLPSGS